MSLIRLSEKQLAANRANAKKSTGPRTPAGKARTATNACKHHLYARKYTIPPVWRDRIIPQALHLTREFADNPELRDLRAHYVYLILWAAELDSLADAYFDHTLRACRYDFHKAVRQWFVEGKLYPVIHSRRMHIAHQTTKVERELAAAKTSGQVTPPSLPVNHDTQVGQASRPVNHNTQPSKISTTAEPTRNTHITSHFHSAHGASPCRRRPAPSTIPSSTRRCRTRQSETHHFICDTIPLRRAPRPNPAPNQRSWSVPSEGI